MIFVIEGEPTPWAAPKRRGRGMYDVKSQEKRNAILDILSQKSRGFTPYDKALCVHVYLAMEIPRSFSKKKRAMAISGELMPTCKPDRSNCLKFAEDILEEAGIITNDSIIVDGRTFQYYSEHPRTTFDVKPYTSLLPPEWSWVNGQPF